MQDLSKDAVPDEHAALRVPVGPLEYCGNLLAQRLLESDTKSS